MSRSISNFEACLPEPGAASGSMAEVNRFDNLLKAYLNESVP